MTHADPPAVATRERPPFWNARTASAALVFALALAVRAAFLVGSADRAWPHSTLFEGDAPVWVRWANALARGEPFEYDVPMRSPGVAYLLHALAPGGLAAPFTLIKGLWCLMGAASCAVLFAVAHAALGARTAWIAALLATFSFGSYQLATSLNGEAPYALLLVLLVGATLRLVSRPSLALALALGLLHGAALLVRAEHALLMFLMLAWSVFAARGARAPAGRAALAALAAALVVVLPWTLRSRAAVERFNTEETQPLDFAAAAPPWSPEAQAFLRGLPAFARGGNFAYAQHLARLSGLARVELADIERFFDLRFGYRPEPLAAWTLSSTKGPLDFALANHPRADGGFTRAALEDGLDAAPQFAFARPSHLALYNRGYSVGWGWIREDPARWSRLVGRKLQRFLDGATLGLTARNLPYGGELLRRPVDLSVPAAPPRLLEAAFLAVAALGAALSFRRDLGALCLIVLGHKLLVGVLFYGYARQAVSIEFVFACFAAVACDFLLTRLRVAPRVAWGAIVLSGLGLLAVDLQTTSKPRTFDARPASDGVSLVRTPLWGAQAFECVGAVQIRAR